MGPDLDECVHWCDQSSQINVAKTKERNWSLPPVPAPAVIEGKPLAALEQ